MKPKYETPGYPLDLRRAERYVVDFEDLFFEPPKEQKPPVNGEKEST